MHRITVGMPAYNCERYIAQSIESVLGQTLGDFELLISDNCSTDGTEAICRDYAARDPRIRYVRQEKNLGGPGNFRYVFTQASGEYHKWATADDHYHPSFLEKCVAVLDQHADVVLCYPHTQLIDAEGRLLEIYQDNLHLLDESPEQRFSSLLARIGLCNAHLGVLRRSAATRTRLIAGERASDVHFLAELTLYGKFWLLPEALFYRRFHEQSSSWNRNDPEHQRKYYSPNARSFTGAHTWRKYAGLLGAVWRAPIPSSHKANLSVGLARHCMWERGDLMKEAAALLWRRK
jgi:glycosyltransferase involved in cell wall biosynthesis